MDDFRAIRFDHLGRSNFCVNLYANNIDTIQYHWHSCTWMHFFSCCFLFLIYQNQIAECVTHCAHIFSKYRIKNDRNSRKTIVEGVAWHTGKSIVFVAHKDVTFFSSSFFGGLRSELNWFFLIITSVLCAFVNVIVVGVVAFCLIRFVLYSVWLGLARYIILLYKTEWKSTSATFARSISYR